MSKIKIVFGILLTLFNIPVSLIISLITHLKLVNIELKIDYNFLIEIMMNEKYLLLFLFIFAIFEIIVISLLLINKKSIFESSLTKITEKIYTPVKVGQSQYGSSRWLTNKEFNNNFKYNIIGKERKKSKIKIINKINSVLQLKFSKTLGFIKKPYRYKSGGLVVGYKDTKNKEKIYYIDDNVHTLTVGATRSGKTRSVVLQTIGNLGLSGESIIISDPKGELYQYTSEYFKKLEYKVVILDFKNPTKSTRYNYLQPVIDAVNRNDYRKAEEYAWDITASLVGNEDSKTEKIWRDGEMSVIAGSIMSVIFDNKENPQYQNLTNVYSFISEMCRTIGNFMPINRYIEELPIEHPASTIFRYCKNRS